MANFGVPGAGNAGAGNEGRGSTQCPPLPKSSLIKRSREPDGDTHDGGRCRPETHEMCGRHAGSDRSSIRIRACPVHGQDRARRNTSPLLSQEEEEASPPHREREVPQNPIAPSPRRARLGAKMPVMVQATPGRGETGSAARSRCSQGPARSSSRNPERGATRTTIPAPPSCKQAAQDQDSQISGSADSWSASSSRPKTFSKPGRS